MIGRVKHFDILIGEKLPPLVLGIIQNLIPAVSFLLGTSAKQINYTGKKHPDKNKRAVTQSPPQWSGFR